MIEKLRNEIQDGQHAANMVLEEIRQQVVKLNSMIAFQTFRENIIDNLGRTIDLARDANPDLKK